VNGLASKTVTIDQATRIRLVGRIVFDDLAVQDIVEDFIEGKTVAWASSSAWSVIRTRL